MSKYEKVGGGEYGVYRQKKTDWWSVICGIAAIFAILMVISAIMN